MEELDNILLIDDIKIGLDYLLEGLERIIQENPSLKLGNVISYHAHIDKIDPNTSIKYQKKKIEVIKQKHVKEIVAIIEKNNISYIIADKTFFAQERREKNELLLFENSRINFESLFDGVENNIATQLSKKAKQKLKKIIVRSYSLKPHKYRERMEIVDKVNSAFSREDIAFFMATNDFFSLPKYSKNVYLYKKENKEGKNYIVSLDNYKLYWDTLLFNLKHTLYELKGLKDGINMYYVPLGQFKMMKLPKGFRGGTLTFVKNDKEKNSSSFEIDVPYKQHYFEMNSILQTRNYLDIFLSDNNQLYLSYQYCYFEYNSNTNEEGKSYFSISNFKHSDKVAQIEGRIDELKSYLPMLHSSVFNDIQDWQEAEILQVDVTEKAPIKLFWFFTKYDEHFISDIEVPQGEKNLHLNFTMYHEGKISTNNIYSAYSLGNEEIEEIADEVFDYHLFNIKSICSTALKQDFLEDKLNRDKIRKMHEHRHTFFRESTSLGNNLRKKSDQEKIIHKYIPKKYADKIIKIDKASRNSYEIVDMSSRAALDYNDLNSHPIYLYKKSELKISPILPIKITEVLEYLKSRHTQDLVIFELYHHDDVIYREENDMINDENTLTNIFLIFWNLINNAVNATAKEGVYQENNVVTINTFVENNIMHISISNPFYNSKIDHVKKAFNYYCYGKEKAKENGGTEIVKKRLDNYGWRVLREKKDSIFNFRNSFCSENLLNLVIQINKK